MKTIIRHIFTTLCAAIAIVSCERKPLYDNCICTNTLAIPIHVNWQPSGVAPQNVSVLFYNTEDGKLFLEHTFEHNSNDIQSYAKLPIGSYTAVIFNELRNQIDYVSCINHEDITTLKFQSNEADPLRSKAPTRTYMKQSGDLAVTTVENIVVTEEMIVEAAYKSFDEMLNTKAVSPETKSTVESLMDVTPLKKNTTINITAHIKNIYYARMPSLVDLTNLADGYYVYGDKNSKTPSTIQFTMNNRTYDKNSLYNGTISATLQTFGTLEDRSSTASHDSSTPIILDLLFKLVDEKQTEKSLDMDVTAKAIHTLESDGSYTIDINVEFEDELPVVEPEGSDGESGFGSEVENWEDVDVPLNQ